MDCDQSAATPSRDGDASAAIDVPSQLDASCYSIRWDVVTPIIIAAIPLAAFRLLGLITHGLDKPDAAPPPAVIAAMIAIQTIGIVAMAFVVLGRLEAAFSRLNAQTNRQPAAWRRLAVILSIACLLLTDILANVAAAFAGAGFLLIAAVPTFLASLACKGIAFAGIPGGQDRAD
jgi:hypothetical protein